MDELIERLRSEAEISDRPGQMDRLNALLGDCDGIHPEQADAAIDWARGKEGE